ncbi:hypothetical protein CMV_013364 [Castanea mollissima]|uniref:Uncharacterized protein n=1 Tax=Castanea mollissima TaxID=60419 RepID=A0A8J4VV16_9ROSI|nr:hypothetical protein CMV_013364 [Castanea mollissima]
MSTVTTGKRQKRRDIKAKAKAAAAHRNFKWLRLEPLRPRIQIQINPLRWLNLLVIQFQAFVLVPRPITWLLRPGITR